MQAPAGERQCADAVLMVRPARFAANPETAGSNRFQREDPRPGDDAAALREFDGLVARLAGAGLTSDGYDIVQPDPEARGSMRAINAALRDADLKPSDVVHVNAHATSTPVGDLAEIAALHQSIGDHPVVTATKSMHGHLLGAAGAVESIATILAIYHSVVPPTINLDDPEDGLLDVAAGKPRHLEMAAALNNSFGFGGHNVALIFTRP